MGKAFWVLIFLGSAILAAPAQVRLHLLFSGELHGVIQSDNPSNHGDVLRLAKAVEQERERRGLYPGDFLFFDTGDALSYNYLSTLDSGQTVFRYMAEAGVDAMVPSNLDINYGIPKLEEHDRAHPGLAVIGANLERKSGEPVFSPFRVFQRQGVRIGVVGIVESGIMDQVTGSGRNDYQVASPEVALRRAVDSLRGEVDLLVSLNQLDLYESLELARRVPGVDIMISKPSSDSVNQVLVYDDRNQVRTAIYPSSVNATAIKHVAVDMSLKGSGFRRSGLEYFREVRVDTLSFEGLDLSTVDSLRQEFRKELKANNRFLTPEHRVARISGSVESEVMDYALYTMLHSTRSEIAILNRGAFVVPPELSQREYLTIRDIVRMSRPNDKIVIMRLTGKSLKAILNRSRQFAPGSNQYLHAMAIGDYSDNGSDAVLPHSQKLDDNQMYAVVTNEFLAGGGDGYSEFQKGTHQRSSFTGDFRIVASREAGAEPVGLSQLLIRYLLRGINGDFTREQAFYREDRFLNRPLVLMKFENIDLSFKSVRVNNNEGFTNPSDGRVRDNTQNATNIASSGYIGIIRNTERTRWENGTLFRYALQAIGDQEIQESDDRLDFQTILDWDDPFGLAKNRDGLNLYSSLRFETEFTSNESSEGERIPRRKDLFFYLGISRFGKNNREIRLAFTTKNNFVTGTQDAGFELNAKYFKDFRWFRHGSILRGRFLFNQPGRQPGSEKASLDYTAYAEFNIIEFISLKPQVNVFIYQDMALQETATNVQFSVSLSFSRLWKPQYIRFIRRDRP